MNNLNVSLLLRGNTIDTQYPDRKQYQDEIHKVKETILEFSESLDGVIDSSAETYKELLTLEALFVSSTPEKVRRKEALNAKLMELTEKQIPYKLVERGPHTKLYLSISADQSEDAKFMSELGVLYDLLACIKSVYRSDAFIGSIYPEIDCSISTENGSMTDINIKSALAFQPEYVKRMVVLDEASHHAQSAMENQLTNALNDLFSSVGN